MTSVGAVTGLAMRELWISFRLLALLAVAMAGGILTTVRPNAASDPQALAWGIAAAAVFLSAMAAATLAAERRDGGVAWLALRSVPRSSVLVGWFNALAIPVLIGFAASAVLAWLAFASGSLTPVDPASFAVLAASAATVGMEALALGLLVGVLARPLPAAVLAVSLSTAGAAAGLLVPVGPGYLPTAGLGLLAQAGNLERPLSAGLQALGLGLALTGMLMAAAAAAFARADL